MSERRISRRSFLAASAMFGVALALDWDKIDALAAKIRDKKDLPVVVVGAGIGGLTCGALLAKRGFPVTVVEQHNIPGGYATTFDRAGGKFTFEVSLHRTAANRELRRLLRELGVLDKIELVKIPGTTRVIAGGHDIRRSNDFNQKIRGLMERYPHEKKGIENFLAAMRAVVKELKTLNAKGGGRDFPSQYPTLWKIKDQTAAAFLDELIKEPKIKRSLASGTMGTFGLPASKLSAFIYVMSKASGESDLYYTKRRSQDLSNALAETIEESGGRIFYEKKIDKIALKDNTVSGVVTSDGQYLPAKIVISNANALETLNKLLPAKALPPDYTNRINGYQVSISTFNIWLGLNREIYKSIKDSHIVISSGRGDEANYLSCLKGEVEAMDLGITIYDNYYEGYSKPGTSSVTIITLCGYQPWQRFAADYRAGRKAAYEKEKERWTSIILKKVEEKAIPGLSAMIEVKEAATPLTNWRYTMNPGGAIYGFNFSVNNSFMKRIKNRTPVKGLYLASAWGNAGAGYSPGLKGGERTFEQVLQDFAGS